MRWKNRALILTFLFTLGILCKVLVFCEGHFNPFANTKVSSFRKECSSSTDALPEATLNKTFKSKRRIEKFGVFHYFLAPFASSSFFTTTQPFVPLSKKFYLLSPVFSLLLPPR
jgi:hypothetical protein